MTANKNAAYARGGALMTSVEKSNSNDMNSSICPICWTGFHGPTATYGLCEDCYYWHQVGTSIDHMAQLLRKVAS